MGFDLTNDSGGYLRFSPSGWALALTLAEQYGWKPEGTTLPESAEGSADWSGEYATNEGQRVSASDANALADACARALDDPAYTEVITDIWNELQKYLDDQLPSTMPSRAVDPDLAQKFRGRLEELIAFARSGSFIIE